MDSEDAGEAVRRRLPYELNEGELVRMSPGGSRHGRIGSNIHSVLGPFVKRHSLGEVFILDTGFLLRRNPDTVRAPDIAFLSHARLAPANEEGFLELAPGLAIEVMSPSDTAKDMDLKVRQYLNAGTKAGWVFYPGARQVTVHEASGRVATLSDNDVLEQPELLPGFRLPLESVF